MQTATRCRLSEVEAGAGGVKSSGSAKSRAAVVAAEVMAEVEAGAGGVKSSGSAKSRAAVVAAEVMA